MLKKTVSWDAKKDIYVKCVDFLKLYSKIGCRDVENVFAGETIFTLVVYLNNGQCCKKLLFHIVIYVL